MTQYDVAILGGGPAGLQCALLLARARRRVAVYDRGEPRNAPAREAHGFFTRDGIVPEDLLKQGREQLLRYDTATFRSIGIDDAIAVDDGFELVLDDAERVRAHKLVIATGMRDRLPSIEGLEACWGRSAFVCPYCDGWEVRDRPIAVWGNTRSGVSLAQELYQWSRDLVVCSGASTPIGESERAWLRDEGVRLKEGGISRLIETDGMLRAIEFEDGERVDREALFLSVTLAQCCDLAENLGCRLTERGHIDVDVEYRTSVPGAYAVGDAVTHMHQIVFAAASGARAAIALNTELLGTTY